MRRLPTGARMNPRRRSAVRQPLSTAYPSHAAAGRSLARSPPRRLTDPRAKTPPALVEPAPNAVRQPLVDKAGTPLLSSTPRQYRHPPAMPQHAFRLTLPQNDIHHGPFLVIPQSRTFQSTFVLNFADSRKTVNQLRPLSGIALSACRVETFSTPVFSNGIGCRQQTPTWHARCSARCVRHGFPSGDFQSQPILPALAGSR